MTCVHRLGYGNRETLEDMSEIGLGGMELARAIGGSTPFFTRNLEKFVWLGGRIDRSALFERRCR